MSISYGWEKLHTAVHSLAGVGTQSDRLVNAISYSLAHINSENDLPVEMREAFEAFYKEITAVPGQGGIGSIQATVDTLDEWGIRKAIEKIIGFYDEICRRRGMN